MSSLDHGAIVRRFGLWGVGALAIALCLIPLHAVAQGIDPSRGADPQVNYHALANHGPWDDRNYGLTQADLRFLPPGDADDKTRIPAFYRVMLRKRYPQIRNSGRVIYPRAADQFFDIYFGGLYVDGEYAAASSEGERPSRATVSGQSEVQVSDGPGRAESAIAINPVFPDIVIAGANGPGRQEMYYSSDGAATWTNVGALPLSCCDPTVDWSSDGTVAYTATLARTGVFVGLDEIINIDAYRSTDFGQTWTRTLSVENGFRDKEYLHVDRSPLSPYKDNVYITWHNWTVMEFVRSTDLGLSYDSVLAFPDAPLGIGSDITTDSLGDIYYAYAQYATEPPDMSQPIPQIILLKSTNGGQTFGNPTVVAQTNGSFIFPLPSIEIRQAFIYVAADADLSGGPFNDSVYLTWTDSTAATSGSPTLNHGRVLVAYSRDGGATWNTSIPHDTTDMDTVDRYHPWLAVDEQGVVHIAYYDTRHSTDRTGVDFYYTNSDDGGVTWNTPQRISTETSDNLGGTFEFGDYNGLSVVNGKVAPIWTDNRPSNTPGSSDVFANILTLSYGAGPIIWLDFAHTGTELGTPANPFNTLAGALAAVDTGGTIKVRGDTTVTDSADTPVIATAVRIESHNGSVRIGVLGGGAKASPLMEELEPVRRRYGFHSAKAEGTEKTLPFTVDGAVTPEQANAYAMALRLDDESAPANSQLWAMVQPRQAQLLRALFADGPSPDSTPSSYAHPQRVWLPLPKDVPSNTVTLSIASLGSEPAWRPAADSTGCFVPGSEIRIRIDGVTYLGFLIRSPGLARLTWGA